MTCNHKTYLEDVGSIYQKLCIPTQSPLITQVLNRITINISNFRDTYKKIKRPSHLKMYLAKVIVKTFWVKLAIVKLSVNKALKSL